MKIITSIIKIQIETGQTSGKASTKETLPSFLSMEDQR